MAVLTNLSNALNLQVTSSTIQSTINHPDYPSVKFLAESLNEWGVSNIVVRLEARQLREIPYPAIAHLSKNNGHFVVLEKLVGPNMIYVDPEIGRIIEPLADFEKKWTGALVLAEKNELSGEEGYREKRIAERFSLWSKRIVWLAGMTLSLIPLFLLRSVWLYLYLSKLAGLIICLALLYKQFGDKSFLSSLCKVGAKSDCDKVINSPASRILGVVNLSEIGLVYFAVGFLSMIVCNLVNLPLPGPIAIFTLISFPLTFVSIYYQRRVIKSWCTLCLAVVVMIWLEFAVTIANPGFSFDTQTIFATSVIFLAIVALWLVLRQKLIDHSKIPGLEAKLQKFTRSENVFTSLLSLQEDVQISELSHEIAAGREDAPIRIVLVTNPTCAPCIAAHAMIKGLLSQSEAKIRVMFRFVFQNNADSDSYKMVVHLIALSITSPDICHEALSSWFLSNGHSDITAWMKKYSILSLNGEMNIINSILRQHLTWARDANITSTPSIILDGKKLPTEYDFAALRYHFKRYIESGSTPVSATS